MKLLCLESGAGADYSNDQCNWNVKQILHGWTGLNYDLLNSNLRQQYERDMRQSVTYTAVDQAYDGEPA
jgi:hypothetical protein